MCDRWKAYYTCRYCSKDYDSLNIAKEQLRQCPDCLNYNSPRIIVSEEKKTFKVVIQFEDYSKKNSLVIISTDKFSLDFLYPNYSQNSRKAIWWRKNRHLNLLLNSNGAQ